MQRTSLSELSRTITAEEDEEDERTKSPKSKFYIMYNDES